jgi:putative PEP-CTERM system TPR-repeat lipoprotein
VTARTLKFAILLLLSAAYASAAEANEYLDDAKRLIASGDLRAARLQLKNAIRSEPQNVEARYRLGDVYLKLGDAVAAEREAKTARDGGYDPDLAVALLARAKFAQRKYQEILDNFLADEGSAERRAEVLIVRGNAQLALNLPQDARESFAEARRLTPQSAEPILAEAKLLVSLHQWETAEVLFDRAIALAPRSPDVLLGKAQLLRRKGDAEGAVRLLDKAIETNPDLVRLRIDRAAALINANDKQRAEADVAAVLAKEPNDGLAVYLRAMLRAKERDFKAADEDLRKLSRIIDKLPNGYYVLAVVKYNLRQLNEAENAAQQHLGRRPDDPAGQKLLAQIELELGRPADALELLAKLQRSGPAEPAIFNLIGRAQLQSGRPEEAASAFEEALGMASDDPALHYWLGVSRLRAGDAESGIEQIARSLDLAPTVPAAVVLVLDHIAAGRYDAAATVVDTLRQAQSDNPMPGNLAGLIKLANFDLAGARKAFAEVAAKYPDFAAARLNLARVADLQGDADEAYRLLERIVLQQPANGRALTQLVQVLLRSGRSEEAVAAAERAHAAMPNDPGITSGLIGLHLQLGDAKKALAVARTEPGSNDRRQVGLIAARARAEVASGLLADAAQTYRRLIAIDPSGIQQRRRLAAVLLRAGETAGAREAIEEASKLSPTNPRLVQDRIALEIKTSGVQAARAWAATYGERHSELPWAAALEGDVLAAAGQLDEAVAAYEEAYRRAPSSGLVLRLWGALRAAGKSEEGAQRLRAWLAAHPDDLAVAAQLGAAAILAQRHDEARLLLEAVVAKQPRDPIALNNLAWLYQMTGDRRALPLAKRAYALAPNAAGIAATLGWILTKDGHAQDGLSLLQRASATNPGNPQIKYHLAVALNDTGRRDAARQVLLSLVDDKANFDEKPAAQRLLAELKR